MFKTNLKNSKGQKAAFLTILCSCISSQHGNQLPPLQAASHIDIQSYVGLWCEIGRYPNRRYLWILSSTSEIHPDILETIVQNVEKQAFVGSNLLLHNKGNLL